MPPCVRGTKLLHLQISIVAFFDWHAHSDMCGGGVHLRSCLLAWVSRTKVTQTHVPVGLHLHFNEIKTGKTSNRKNI